MREKCTYRRQKMTLILIYLLLILFFYNYHFLGTLSWKIKNHRTSTFVMTHSSSCSKNFSLLHMISIPYFWNMFIEALPFFKHQNLQIVFIFSVHFLFFVHFYWFLLSNMLMTLHWWGTLNKCMRQPTKF